MSNQRSYSHFKISDLAEGTQAKGESAEPASNFQMTTVSVVHSGFGDKDFPAEEGLLCQVGVEYEGRDDTDAQDAAQTAAERKRQRNAQMVQYGSSNPTPAR